MRVKTAAAHLEPGDVYHFESQVPCDYYIHVGWKGGTPGRNEQFYFIHPEGCGSLTQDNCEMEPFVCVIAKHKLDENGMPLPGLKRDIFVLVL